MSTNNERQPVKVEQIMQEIRGEILRRRALQKGKPPIVSAKGERLSPDYYEHLHLGALAHDQLIVEPLITPVPIPVLGPIIQGLRARLHQLVLYYTNQFAASQQQVNAELLQATDQIGRQLETDMSEHGGKDE